MLTFQTMHAVHPEQARTLDTEGLRRHFLVDASFRPGEIRLTYTHYDRSVLGGAVPDGDSLPLSTVKEAGTPVFLNRREMGVVNIGDTGEVAISDESWTLHCGDVLYLGMGGARSRSGEGAVLHRFGSRASDLSQSSGDHRRRQGCEARRCRKL